jgi:uncharacterized protein (DUF1499 family)
MKIIIRFIQILLGIGIVLGCLSLLMALLARFVKRPANLGIHEGQLASCPNMPNCVNSQSVDPRHQIAPITYSTTPEQAHESLISIIGTMELGKVISVESGYIYAEFRSKGMSYVDDVEFYFDPDVSVIHFRSSARLPYSDWGVNRNRMEEICNAYITREDILNE